MLLARIFHSICLFSPVRVNNNRFLLYNSDVKYFFLFVCQFCLVFGFFLLIFRMHGTIRFAAPVFWEFIVFCLFTIWVLRFCRLVWLDIYFILDFFSVLLLDIGFFRFYDPCYGGRALRLPTFLLDFNLWNTACLRI